MAFTRNRKINYTFIILQQKRNLFFKLILNYEKKIKIVDFKEIPVE